MVNQQLLNYIVQQEQAGFSETQIQQALVRAGYSENDIKEAFSSLKSGTHDPDVHQYVEQYARSGYSASQVFVMLKEQGHSASEVRKAISEVYGKGSLASSDVPHTHIFLFSILALLIGAGSMYFVVAGLSNGSGTDPYVPPGGGVISFSPSEIIQDIIDVARREGKDEGVSQCESRLRGQNRDQCLQSVAVIKEISDPNICMRIEDFEIHDSCLFNFLNSDFEMVCSSVKLAKTQSTCQSLTSLRSSA